MRQPRAKTLLAILMLGLFFSGHSFSQTKKPAAIKNKSTKKTAEKTAKPDDSKRTEPAKAVVTPKPAPTSVADIKKLPAYIKSNNIRTLVYLIGMTDTDLEHVAKFRKLKIPITEIQSANFLTDYDPYQVRVMERKQEYSQAASQIIRDVAPALKYITLPDNNLVDPLSDAAYLYLKAASVYDDKKSPEYDKKKAQEEYAKAYRVFNKITQAEWYYGAQLAELNTIFCNIRMDKLDVAQKEFAKIEEPVLGDAAYGLYWLIDAQLKFHNKKFNEALDSVVKSIVFDSKNINTFPEALLLSAYCYEDMLDNYRARDTFFEIAKLFQGTPEGEIAFSSIQFIRSKKLTDTTEDVGLEKVFFDSIEDMNKKVDDFIVVVQEEERIKEEKRKEREKQKEKNK